MKRNIILVITILIIALIAYFLLRSEKVIQNVKIYEPGTTIGSLFEEDLTFEEIDRTDPMGTLFSKTLVTDPAQLDAIYDQDTRNSNIMELIYKDGLRNNFKDAIYNDNPLFSFHYEGMYGPLMWFCFFEDKNLNLRYNFDFEFEDDTWRQITRLSKYPVLIEMGNIGEKSKIFKSKTPLTPEIIRDFIARCQQIDEIITERMQTDPDYYNPVQDGPY